MITEKTITIKVDVDDFVPVVVKSNRLEFALMLVEISRCPVCRKYMLGYDKNNNPFPRWWKVRVESQMERAGFVKKSCELAEEELICIECASSGMSYFICSLCGEKRSSDLIEYSFGDPPEKICSICYNTVTAKTWDEFVAKIHEQHRYDFD